MSLEDRVFGWWLVDHVCHPRMPSRLGLCSVNESVRTVPEYRYLGPLRVDFMVLVVNPSCSHCTIMSIRSPDIGSRQAHKAILLPGSRSTCYRTGPSQSMCPLWYHLDYSSVPNPAPRKISIPTLVLEGKNVVQSSRCCEQEWGVQRTCIWWRASYVQHN